MSMCRVCHVHPAVFYTGSFPVCLNCSLKNGGGNGFIGADSSQSGSTKSSLITLGTGLVLLAAIAGTLYLYSMDSGKSAPVRFGFGLK